MATPGSVELRTEIRAILKDADLTNLSAKKVRRELEEKFSADLTKRKKEIDDLIMEAINEKEEKEKDEEMDKNNGAVSSDSDSDSVPLDCEPVKKKAKMQIKKSKHRGAEDADEQLAKRLQDEEDVTPGPRTRSGRQSKPAKSRGGGAKKKAKKTGSSPKKQTGYGKPCQLSEQLGSLMGCTTMARSDVVKRMWEIVKERGLQDPQNKQFMICDDELLKIFGRRRVRTFGMMKYLADHIYALEEQLYL